MSGPREIVGQGTRSPTLIALVVGLALVFPSMQAVAGGRAVSGYSIPIPGLSGTGTAATVSAGTGTSNSSASTGHTGLSSMVSPAVLKALMASKSSGGSPSPSFMQNSPTTMAASPFSPTLMATTSTDPGVASRATASIIYGHSGSRNIGHTSTMPKASSWASSGMVWPTANPTGSTGHSSSKGSSLPKPVTLATWPAVDTSAATSPSH